MGKLLSENLIFKVLAVLLAIFIWIWVSGDERFQGEFSIPLKLINVPPHLVLTNAPPAMVTVQARGAAKELISFYSERIHAEVDLGSLPVGFHEFPLRPANVIHPGEPSIEIVEVVSPVSAIVTLDSLVNKSVPVQSQVMVQTAHGYFLDSLIVDPAQVWLRGPKSTLARIDSIPTEKMVLHNINLSTTRLLKLMPPNQEGVTAASVSVKVELRVVKMVTTTLKHVPVKMVNLPRGTAVALVPPEIELFLMIPPKYQDSARPSAFSATVDWHLQNGEGGAPVQPTVAPPAWAEVLSMTPPKLMISRIRE